MSFEQILNYIQEIPKILFGSSNLNELESAEEAKNECDTELI